MKNITLVLGTAREDNKSRRVLLALEKELANKTSNLEIVDIKDHVLSPVTTPPWGQGGADTVPTKWKEIAGKTDTFIFILPEYNHGYPGEWKILMDSLYAEYAGKDVYLAGVSKGTFAGVRVVEHVQPVLHMFGLVLKNPTLYVGDVESSLDETGKILNDKLKERVEEFTNLIIS